MSKVYSAVNPRNNLEISLYYKASDNTYELRSRPKASNGMYRVLMTIDNIKDAYHEYNAHLI
jgi:hypothetical protein